MKPRTGGPSFGALLEGVGIGRRPFLSRPPERVTKAFLTPTVTRTLLACDEKFTQRGRHSVLCVGQ